MSDELQSRYFGEPWPSGVCEDGEQVDVPVGQFCTWCGEEFKEGDQGWLMGAVYRGGVLQPWSSGVHRECGLRMVVGGIECLKRQHAGTHVVGDHDPDPPHLTKREAAQAAWAWIQEHGQ